MLFSLFLSFVYVVEELMGPQTMLLESPYLYNSMFEILIPCISLLIGEELALFFVVLRFKLHSQGDGS